MWDMISGCIRDIWLLDSQFIILRHAHVAVACTGLARKWCLKINPPVTVTNFTVDNETDRDVPQCTTF